MGPKALPRDIVARWNREFNRILQLPDVKQRMAVLYYPKHLALFLGLALTRKQRHQFAHDTAPERQHAHHEDRAHDDLHP